ncbi:MAG: T9SS type A sorting domain-containing protein, partial [Bacteriodetes bacterium]|nr:T9SS type A sorting domain-containing protein [Bacteroidota bacterium]
GIKSVALLADGKTLCVSEVVEVYNYGIQKKVSEEYIGEVIDIETGERKAVAKDIYRFIAIPGSNDVISVGKKESSKPFDTYFLMSGLDLNKKFDYPLIMSDSRIYFNNDGTTFLYVWANDMKVVEVQSGKIQTSVHDEEGFGYPYMISNSKKYVAGGGLTMYEFTKLFNITDVIINDNAKFQPIPQPSTGILKITNNNIHSDNQCTIKVFDVNGRDLSIKLPIISQQEGSIILDVSSLPNGQYTLTLQQVDKVFSYPFILTK